MIFPYVSLLKKCIMNNRHANVTAKWNLRNGNEGFAASMRPGTAEYFGIYAVGGAEIVADIFAGGVSGAPEELATENPPPQVIRSEASLNFS